jgi:hypothetical protein
MEIIPYLVGVAMFVLVVYWSAANATVEQGQPSFGLFRFPESAAGAKAAEQERRRLARSFQPQKPIGPEPPATPPRRTAAGPVPRPAPPAPAPRLPRR